MVAAMSLTALNTPAKDDADTKLLEKLVEDGGSGRGGSGGTHWISLRIMTPMCRLWLR